MSEVLSQRDYLFLQALDLQTDGKLAAVLNANGCANWTVCPQCRVDDFTHVEGCRFTPSAQVGTGVLLHNFPSRTKKKKAS